MPDHRSITDFSISQGEREKGWELGRRGHGGMIGCCRLGVALDSED
jgi:hypothetical protein